MAMENQVQQLHEETKLEIEQFLQSVRSEIDGTYQVCSVMDAYITADIASQISQQLINIVNEDDPARGKAKFQYFYLKDEQKCRFVMWGSPLFVGELLVNVGKMIKFV